MAHFIRLHLTSLCLFITASLGASSGFQNCPILGPLYPSPNDFSSSPEVQAAGLNFTNIIEQALTSGVSELGPLAINTTTFSINVFSAHENASLYQYHYTSPTVANFSADGSKQASLNSIYRVASVSKLLTVLTLLVQDGYTHWDRPVSDYIPELRVHPQNRTSTFKFDPIYDLGWKEMTIGDLASQISGTPHDYGFEDNVGLGSLEEQVLLGFPPLPNKEIPPCSLGEMTETPEPPCGRQAFLNGLKMENPSYAPGTTPAYSNAAYQVLSYALEAITGKTFETMFAESILNPLNLNATSLTQPNSTADAIIPFNETASEWNYDLGDGAAFGGMYSSPSDLTLIGRTILQSAHTKTPLRISPALTRRWLKPSSHTNSLTSSVGAPWEIFRYQMPNVNHVVDLYTKTGNVGAYADTLVLVPDWEIGFVITAADLPNPLVNVWTLASLLIDQFFPAFDTAARQEADDVYAGQYTYGGGSGNGTVDAGLNSTIVLSTDPDKPGLGIDQWISNGTDFLGTLAAIFGYAVFTARLYPAQLHSEEKNGTGNMKQVAFRAVYEDPQAAVYTGLLSPLCLSWLGVDSERYGSIALDQFVFNLPVTDGNVAGKASSIEPRALRVKLERTA